ncbi:MAG: hypothetical protein QOF89_6108 [Acidobacteriota bacterium]|jgi:hypothetical protein|nr:hypothetical protein [Acidobacteriota bacterium]
MKKRMVLFLMAVALAATALSSKPIAAKSLCGAQLACLIGPVCCSDLACSDFCNSLNPGGTPHCSGSYPEGGCCDCQGAVEGL